MREELIGYLVNALEPFEREHVERHLASSPQLRDELAVLRRGLRPFEAAPADVEPPRALAQRTCEFVWNHDRATLPVRSVPLAHDLRPAASPRRWSLADIAVAAGIVVAASAIILPAVNQSRAMARMTACSDNLRELGLSLTQYSRQHGNTFPAAASEGAQAAAGVYAPKLRDAGLLLNPRSVICPASALAGHANGFQIPTLEQLNAAHGEALARLQARMGGSYGYNLGYVSGHRYHPPHDLGRKNFAIMADAPRQHASGRASVNHGAPGQNVLFEDGHVNFLNSSSIAGRDDIFLNDQGQVALGLHRSDAVVAPSAARPFSPQLEILPGQPASGLLPLNAPSP